MNRAAALLRSSMRRELVAMPRLRLVHVLYLFVAACWTGEPPTEPTRPTSIAVSDETTPLKETTPPKQPRPIADKALAHELRVAGQTKLTKLVSGPVVVLDLDAGAFTTLCGSAAVLAANNWGAKLADPNRDAPKCVVEAQQVRCNQFVAAPIRAATPDPEWLVLGLGTVGQLRLRSAIVGRDHRAIPLMDQLDAHVASASCP